MRALLVATLALSAFFTLPGAGALLPTACAEASSTSATNFAWTPSCLEVSSGEVVTFVGAGGTHNARSAQDDLPVLRALGPICFQTSNFDPGQSAAVRFVHDSDGVTASLRNADGSWGAPVDCDLAVDPLASTAARASIPFECGIHASMTGRIVVERLG